MEDEENEQNQQPSVGEQLKEAGKEQVEQIAKDTAKKAAKEAGKVAASAVKKAAIKVLPAIAPYLLIALLIIFTAVGIFVTIDKVQEIGGNIGTSLISFLRMGDNGPVLPSGEEIVEAIDASLAEFNIDAKDLGLGNESQKNAYLFKFMATSMSTQLPYIKDSTAKTLKDIALNGVTGGAWESLNVIKGKQDVQGIVKIKRQTGNNTIELTYKKYDELMKLIEQNDPSSIQYFSLDESWMLWVSKCTTITVTNPDGTKTVTNEVQAVSIPYQTLISKYSVPFEFFIALQLITSNPEYVSAVADLVHNGEIELTIFDTQQTVTEEYTYKYKVSKKWLEEVTLTEEVEANKPAQVTRPNGEIVTSRATTRFRIAKKLTVLDSDLGLGGGTSSSSAQETEKQEEIEETETTNTQTTITEKRKEWKTSTSEEIIETTITVKQTSKLDAEVTKADVWVIKQDAKYKIENIEPQYPLGKEPEPVPLEDEEEPKGENGEEVEGEWKVDRSEKTKQTVEGQELKLESSSSDIDEDKFIKLWRNALGTKVYYVIPTGVFGGFAAPIDNILSAEEWLYHLLEKSENTSMHAQLMRYLIAYYKNPNTAVKPDLSIFNTSGFTETNWYGIGNGYWWPLQDTTQTKITSDFGYRDPVYKDGVQISGGRIHEGIDIGVPVGSEVIASADGVVEIAGESKAEGRWIRINHSNGIKTVYMHNSVLLVTVGQEVKQGDTIALSGNTGNSNGPHLHFGVEVNGEYVVPLDYVSKENPRPINTSPNVPANVEAWRPYIAQAFNELGYTSTPEKVNAILKQIETESSGDQYIIQGIIDSNSDTAITIGDGTCPWCSSFLSHTCGDTNIGHGLLQFIPTTFYSNMITGHTNIFNGYDQIITCITMLEKRAGSYTDYIGRGTGWG